MILSNDQQRALDALQGTDNVFLTGAAGSGKSFVLKQYLKTRAGADRKVPVLASTGAAAILVGGRTFHSFFGLGIMEGGVEKTVERALQNRRLKKRLVETETVVIDEVSMISGAMLRAAEAIARKARGNTTPWGGLRVIAVGDFAQLPPVNPFGTEKDWAFLDPVWRQTEFQPVVLREIHRSSDSDFLEVLNDVRRGEVTERVRAFLDARTSGATGSEADLTRLFPRRDAVERFNLARLEEIPHPLRTFNTEYQGKERDIEAFRRHSPLPDVVQLKVDALIMLRQNDPEGRWVNGSLAHVVEIADHSLGVRLVRNGKTVKIEEAEFTLLNADGEPVVKAVGFPVGLAWAMTIHKAQGATLDQVRLDLRRAWEPGQAYVALSRASSPDRLFLDGWSPSSILADPEVARFHRELK